MENTDYGLFNSMFISCNDEDHQENINNSNSNSYINTFKSNQIRSQNYDQIMGNGSSDRKRRNINVNANANVNVNISRDKNRESINEIDSVGSIDGGNEFEIDNEDDIPGNGKN